MKLWKKLDWFILILIFLIFGLSFAMVSYLPDKVPIHWDMRGEVDGWGSKYISLFLMPSITLFIFLLMSFLPAIDPLRKNYEKFAKPYRYFKIFLTFFFIYLYFFLIFASLEYVPPIGSLMFSIPFSLMICFIGWVLPQLKRNFFIGIRIPWTLTSDENWEKTHIFGGKVFFAAGIVSLLASFFGGAISFIVLISSIILATIVIVIYSYLFYRKNNLPSA